MNIGKKVAVLAVAAGALVMGSAAGASAHGIGGGGFIPFGAYQGNTCDTSTGAIAAASVGAATGDITAASNCLNFTQGIAAYQDNDCDTATGPIAAVSGTAPTGAITAGSNCTNIAYGTP